MVQQGQCVPGNWVTQPRQPPALLTRERIQVAPDHFNE